MSDTMWVVMTLTISGGRADGRPWPDRLDTSAPLDVPREEGEHLVKVGQAFEVPAPPHAKPAPAPAPAGDPVSEASATAAGPVPAAVPAAAEEAAPPPAEAPAEDPPKPADSKQAWMDYATGQGASSAAVAEMTKADLMSRFGGRL